MNTTPRSEQQLGTPPPNPIREAVAREQKAAELRKIDNATLEDAMQVAKTLKVEISEPELIEVVNLANAYARKGKAKGTAREAVLRYLSNKKNPKSSI